MKHDCMDVWKCNDFTYAGDAFMSDVPFEMKQIHIRGENENGGLAKVIIKRQGAC